MCKFIGIDISKQTFDVSFLKNQKWEHYVFENKLAGFKKLIKLLNTEDWVVMEASGSYYLPLRAERSAAWQSVEHSVP